MRWLSALLLCLIASAALAQNPTCPTRPAGTAGNACASVDFVAENAAAGFLVTAPPFNAVCDGATDDSAAINAAIVAAGASTLSKIVYVPDRTCKVNSSINLGNGTSSTASTYQGVIIRGLGDPNTAPIFPGFIATTGPKLLWGGSGTVGVISVNGPIQGWGIENLYIDCASIANSIGVLATSAQNGETRNLSLINCAKGYGTTTVAPFGSFTNTNTQHNKHYNTTVQVPAVANSVGVILTGTSSADTDYETWVGTDVFLPTSSVVSNGFQLQATESDTFVGTHFYGGNASSNSVVFDYSVNSSWPASIVFTNIDPFQSGGGAQWTNGGTVPGAGAKPNYILPLGQTNSSTCPNIVNLFCLESNRVLFSPGGNVANFSFFPPPAWTTWAPAPVCGTATFTVTAAKSYTIGKSTNITMDFNFATIGNCAQTTLTFTLPNTANTSGGFGGNNSNAAIGVNCRIGAGSATVTCQQAGNVNFVAADRLFLTATYENQ